MAFPLPTSLTPSKVASFKDCALAFRFSAIDKLPEPPSAPALKGTLVHRVLERLFWEREAGKRTIEEALTRLEEEAKLFFEGEEYLSLDLPETEQEKFRAEAEKLVHNYFTLEDPNTVNTVGTELMLEAKSGTMLLRGIIDRLDKDENGDLVVVDYKTGRAPGANFEANKMAGVHFYAYLCEEVLGRRPVAVKLMYLKEPVTITAIPNQQSIRGLTVKTNAIWTAVEKACDREDFRPNPGKLCSWCSFHEYCPAKGGTLPVRADVAITPKPESAPPAQAALV
jgi:putative RecB family exonuclease